jgi:hypothetical protein
VEYPIVPQASRPGRARKFSVTMRRTSSVSQVATFGPRGTLAHSVSCPGCTVMVGATRMYGCAAPVFIASCSFSGPCMAWNQAVGVPG